MAISYGKLIMGKKSVADLEAAAEEMDYELITVGYNGKRCQSEKQIGTFDVLKPAFNGDGSGSDWVVARGVAIFLPDNKGNRRAFLIDTPFNKEQLARSLANGKFAVARKYKDEIEKIAIINGWPLVRPARVSEFSQESARERTLAHQLTTRRENEMKLKHELADQQSATDTLKAQIAELQYKLERQDFEETEARLAVRKNEDAIETKSEQLEEIKENRISKDLIIPAKIEVEDDGEITNIPAKKAPKPTAKKTVKR